MPFNKSWEIYDTKRAPMMLKITLGIPNLIMVFLSSPTLKKPNLLKFPNRWKKATRASADLKSKKNKARGKSIVDDPKPAMVPITSAKKAVIMKSIDIYAVYQLFTFLNNPIQISQFSIFRNDYLSTIDVMVSKLYGLSSSLLI